MFTFLKQPAHPKMIDSFIFEEIEDKILVRFLFYSIFLLP